MLTAAKPDDRYSFTQAPFRNDEPYPREGDEARAGCSEYCIPARTPVQASRQRPAWLARPSLSREKTRAFRARVLLASASRMCFCLQAKIEYCVLGKKV